MKLGFIVNRSSMMTSSWTTIQIACAALELGHEVGFIDRMDLSIQSDGSLKARAHWFEPGPTPPEHISTLLQSRQARRKNIDLWSFERLFLRTKPLYPNMLAIALMAKEHGIPVVNDPLALMRTSSKSWLATRIDVSTPETLITSSQATAEMFYQKQPQGVVLKPDAGSGGQDVSLVHAGDYALFHETFRRLIRNGHPQVVVQANVGAQEHLESRLLWLDGQIIGGYQRRRATGEFRHNLLQGATAEPYEITQRDNDLIAPLSRHLLNAGIRFAGIDVLGSYILEVNVLNPGGAFHADRLNETTLAQTILTNLISNK